LLTAESLRNSATELILEDRRSFNSQAWWLGVFLGLAIMLVVLAINFVGDGLRYAPDVREADA